VGVQAVGVTLRVKFAHKYRSKVFELNIVKEFSITSGFESKNCACAIITLSQHIAHARSPNRPCAMRQLISTCSAPYNFLR